VVEARWRERVLGLRDSSTQEEAVIESNTPRARWKLPCGDGLTLEGSVVAANALPAGKERKFG
jgi:hypothetical protein